jgi:hypothetical protein
MRKGYSLAIGNSIGRSPTFFAVVSEAEGHDVDLRNPYPPPPFSTSSGYPSLRLSSLCVAGVAYAS